MISRERVLEWARNCKFAEYSEDDKFVDFASVTPDELERFAELAYAAGQRDERELVEQDALRYRWLRSDRWYVQVMSDLMDRFPKFCVLGSKLDAAIDRARGDAAAPDGAL